MLLCTLLLSACATSPSRRPTQGAEAQQRPNPMRDFDRIAPRVGDEAPDFNLRTAEGVRVRLSEAVGKGPVVLVFGSFS